MTWQWSKQVGRNRCAEGSKSWQRSRIRKRRGSSVVLALELEEVDQGSEEEEKKLDLERVEEEEEERSMRGQDVEIWRRELPPGHCLG